MNRKVLLTIIAFMVVLGSLVTYVYWTTIGKPLRESLGEAQITVHGKGDKMVLNPETPHFRELQLACEDVLVSSGSFFPFDRSITEFPSDPREVVSTEWAVEIAYASPVEVEVILQSGRTTLVFNPRINVSRVVIPLTGELTRIEGEAMRRSNGGGYELKQGKYVMLFLSPEIVFRGDDWKGLVGSPSDLQEIRDILPRFDIGVP